MTMMNARVQSASRAWGRWAAAAAALAAGPALAVNDLKGGPGVNQINLPEPVTTIARDQMWLHNFMLIVCLVIFVAVFGVMFYSIFKHRKSKGAVSANFHESVAVEIAWTVVPFLIVIGMALPATKVVVAMKDTTNADLTIKATGYQQVGLRLHQGRRRGHRLPGHPRHRAARGLQLGQPAAGRQLPAEGRQPAGGAGRQEGPHHHHRQRRHPRLDGAGLRRQAGCHPRLRA